jgi:hypothetical protein
MPSSSGLYVFQRGASQLCNRGPDVTWDGTAIVPLQVQAFELGDGNLTRSLPAFWSADSQTERLVKQIQSRSINLFKSDVEERLRSSVVRINFEKA